MIIKRKRQTIDSPQSTRNEASNIAGLPVIRKISNTAGESLSLVAALVAAVPQGDCIPWKSE